MSQIVAQGNGLGQILVEAQAPGYGSGNLGHFKGVGKPGPIVVAFGGYEDLGLMLEAPESLAMGDSIPIPLKGGTQGARSFRDETPLALGAETGPRRQGFGFQTFLKKAHGIPLLGSLFQHQEGLF